MRAERAQLHSLAFWLILIAGALVRLLRFGSLPAGLNQDEAFAAYEAWSLLRTGLDTAGWPFPVYLTAWGSGMNALESYLMLPFLAVFGLRVWAARLPQLLTALLSLPCIYGLARRIWDEEHGLVAMLLLAVCPWHVLLSRWGLESNLAPGFLLFGLYCFLRGTGDSRWLLPAGLLYGLSLYAYATVWPVLPPLLLAQIVYCARHRKLRWNAWAAGGLLLLVLLALPLLLFLAVNRGWIAPIRTAFFSVPKLLVLRAGEFSLQHIPENAKNLLDILWRQSDDLPWNSAGPFGLLYPISGLFILPGLALLLLRRARALRDYHPETLLLFQLLAALALGLLVSVNVNRVNILFIPLVLLCADGVCRLGKLAKGRALPVILTAYLLFFGFFAHWYFTDFSKTVAYNFACGLEEAIAAAPEDGLLVFSDDVFYPTVLFYTQTDPDTFRDTVTYKRYPAAFLKAAGFDRFRFGLDGWPEDTSYILSVWTDSTALEEPGCTIRRFGYYKLITR